MSAYLPKSASEVVVPYTFTKELFHPCGKAQGTTNGEGGLPNEAGLAYTTLN